MFLRQFSIFRLAWSLDWQKNISKGVITMKKTPVVYSEILKDFLDFFESVRTTYNLNMESMKEDRTGIRIENVENEKPTPLVVEI